MAYNGPKAVWVSGLAVRYNYSDALVYEINAAGWTANSEQENGVGVELQTGVLPAIVHHLNHRLVLHASTVTKNGQAISIAAPSGGGKSTMAAALRGIGYELAADDHLIVEPHGSSLVALPGPAQTRVWREVADHFDIDINEATPVIDARDKWIVQQNVVEEAVPLSHWFVLERGADEIAIKPIKPPEAHREAFANRFIVGLVNQRREQWYFDLVTRLANEVPCARVKSPDGIEHVRDVAKAIDDYVSSSRNTT